ncbi:Type II secretion system F domain-containing protein [Alkalidesulfovibrio alkalitolerans DSM 16529]|jgi:tight adherence protein B|uniref:Type II secretion system F domain-containing protein n=1 Tax=Alkalidesulfovibrio alkalitolerans DSM 16529 TaxID=1121439 RepID=S7UGZ4_9BACT|nr:type II secretion system F family protein [Alkalidesulfovibrio alkalitolerans]EPR31518.1 Type II secretion system F domain-containing protein [Alkalidesulfovibrio alkalitolerans DSM 16529]
MGWLLLVSIALAVFLAVNGVLGLMRARADARDAARQRMDRLVHESLGAGATNLLRADAMARRAGLLERLVGGGDLRDHIRRAGMSVSPGFVLLIMTVCAAVLGVLAWVFAGVVAAIPAALAGLYLPYAVIKGRAKARMERFTRQLPDALDLVGRALKAGHAFAGALRMIADECDDPIGPEFAATLDEINYGLSVEQALANLLRRVDCPDLKFFVVSVNIQRESGGNLTEIVTSIATLIRERYKLAGKVRTLSAEGKLSAIILICLPFAVGLILYLMNPVYMSVLWEKDIGRLMLMGAGVSMFKGVIWIRKLVNIQV